MPVDVLVPPVGTNVDTVTLVTWYRREGEAVTKDEPLFAVETDKATLDVEAPASGVLRQVACAEGAEVAALSRIAVIAAPGEAVGGQEEGRGQTLRVPVAARGEDLARSVAMPLPEGRSEAVHERIFVSPRAKRLAESRELDWRDVRGTGPEGAIVERDVVAALDARAAFDARATPAITPLARTMADRSGVDWRRLEGSGTKGKIVREDVEQAITRPETPAPEGADGQVLETVPLSGLRGVLVERMARSSSENAAVTLTSQVDATGLVALRTDLKADGIEVSYNDLLLLILSRALREHPRVNASIDGDRIAVWKRIDIGIAVDTERGLLAPVVRDVDRKGLAEIAAETRALVATAREGRLKPEDLRGSTFTLTNLGMYDIDAFTPLINSPECAILGVGRIRAEPAVVDGQIVVRQQMWLSLTFDHRVIDGGPAARFMQRIARLVTRPHLLLT